MSFDKADIFGRLTSPAPAKELSKVATIIFSSDSDLILTVPSPAGLARYQVNSGTLCVASSVFRAMLETNSSFKEGQALASRRSNAIRSNPPKKPLVEISLPADNPYIHALAVVFRIIHMQNSLVPQTVNQQQLYQIAVICDKYDLREALLHWLNTWMPADFELGGKELTIDKWLFMSYAFAKEDAFKKWTLRAILHSRLDGMGNLNLCGESGEWFIPTDNIPQSVLEQIKHVRQKTLQNMFNCARRIFNDYINLTPRCKLPDGVFCDALVYGILQRELISKGLRLEFAPGTALRQETRSGLDINTVKELIDNLPFPPNLAFGTGCCSKPSRIIYHPPYCSCSKCKRCQSCLSSQCKFSTAQEHTSCPPFKEVKSIISKLVAGIEGLEYSKFGRKKVASGEGKAPVSRDPWSCLEFQ